MYYWTHCVYNLFSKFPATNFTGFDFGYQDWKETFPQLIGEWKKGLPAVIYTFKVNNSHTRTMYEICSNLTIKTPDRRC